MEEQAVLDANAVSKAAEEGLRANATKWIQKLLSAKTPAMEKYAFKKLDQLIPADKEDDKAEAQELYEAIKAEKQVSADASEEDFEGMLLELIMLANQNKKQRTS